MCHFGRKGDFKICFSLTNQTLNGVMKESILHFRIVYYYYLNVSSHECSVVVPKINLNTRF